MNKTLRTATVAVAGMLLIAATGAQAGIAGSKHDFTASGGGQGTSAGTRGEQICIFCHTPHGANTAASAPLWNKPLNTDQDRYTRYSALNTASLDGAEAPVGSVSLACLSCHDGTQAMDSLINGPGSGNYNASGDEYYDATTKMTGEPIPMLGEDLTNDHPISIQYAGGGCSDSKTTCGTGDFGDPDFNVPDYATINSTHQWWIDTDASNTRDKTDMILYTRNFSGTEGPSVECASCHDPHEEASTPVSFLRVNNANSAVCLACHTK